MGKAWDRSGIAYNADLWRQVFRVLKPGAHMLAFGGTRTYHRMAVAIEDAGFEIRDQIGWLYGSGFPKSLDVSKAIDKLNGSEREVIGKSTKAGPALNGQGENPRPWHEEKRNEAGRLEYEYTAPSSDDAKAWDGWGTGLKPAWEPLCLARRPLERKLTVAENVLKYGTGAINIDGSRVPTDDVLTGSGSPPLKYGGSNPRPFHETAEPLGMNQNPLGRFPANVIHDGSDEVEAEFAKAGDRKSGSSIDGWEPSEKTTEIYSTYADRRDFEGYLDSGSASRFFYVAKAAKSDRHGLDGTQNNHTTVKPTELMAYLCRMITPPGGLILDPFAGSGSTMKAATIERFKCVGIELHPEHLDIARGRQKLLQVRMF